MSKENKMDSGRRRILASTCVVGGVGVVAAAVPFVSSMLPSERAKAAGAPVEADISKLAPGQMMTVGWRGKPIWILHRTKEMLDSLTAVEPELADPKSENSIQPANCKNQHRSIKPEILVAIGICTHLGCSPSSKFAEGTSQGMPADWKGGFLCPCHGSTFDLAARVFKEKPAPTNLVIPPHYYISDTRILIGEEKKGA